MQLPVAPEGGRLAEGGGSGKATQEGYSGRTSAAYSTGKVASSASSRTALPLLLTKPT